MSNYPSSQDPEWDPSRSRPYRAHDPRIETAKIHSAGWGAWSAIFSFMIAVPFLLIGLMGMWLTLDSLEPAIDNDWTPTKGTVVFVESHLQCDGTCEYRCDVYYQYAVGGVQYEGNNLEDLDPRAQADGCDAAYPTGDTVTTYYDRDEQSSSLLSKEKIDFGFALFGLFLWIPGAAAVALCTLVIVGTQLQPRVMI